MAKAAESPVAPPATWLERNRQAATYSGIILGLLLVGIVAIATTPPPAWGVPSRQIGHPVALLIDPADGQTVYAGTEAGKIWGSTDSGQTWTDHSAGLPAQIAVSALLRSADGKRFVAGTSAGAFTQDAAQQWVASSGGLPKGAGIDALAFAGTDAAVTLAGTERNGIYRTTDAGNTWSPVGGLAGSADVYGLTTLPDNQTVFAALIGAGIYRSTDAGATWAARNGGLPSKTDAFAIVPTLDAKGTVTALLAGTSAGIWRSTDGGATWLAANAGLPKTRAISLAVDPRQTQQVVAGTDAGVFVSVDGGAHWKTLAKGLPSGQHIGAVTLSSKNGNVAYAAGDVLYRYPGAGNPPTAVVGRVAILGALITGFIWLSSRQRRVMRDLAPKLPANLQQPGAAGRLGATNRPKPAAGRVANGHIRGGPPPRVPDAPTNPTDE